MDKSRSAIRKKGISLCSRDITTQNNSLSKKYDGEIRTGESTNKKCKSVNRSCSDKQDKIKRLG
jgi:hypothetical protein